MKKTILLLLALIGFTLVSHAQTDTRDTTGQPPALFSFGVDVGPVLSPSNQTFSTAAGISLKLELPFSNPRAFFTVTAAYNNLSTKNTPATDTLQNGHFIPLMIGFKYFILKHVFIEGDIGDSFDINDSYLGYQNAFTFAPQVGVSIPLSKPNTYVDISAYYQGRRSGAGDVNQAAIRVAYKFGM